MARFARRKAAWAALAGVRFLQSLPLGCAPFGGWPQIRTYPYYLFIDCFNGIPLNPSIQLADFAKPLRSSFQVYQNYPN